MLTRNDMFKLELFGPLRLHAPGGQRIPIASQKGMALLALLATSPSGERSRSWLQDQLWGSRAEEQAQGSLRRELANLRQALATAGEPVLTSDRDRVALDTARFWIDIRDAGQGVAGGCAFLEGLDLPGEEAFEDWLRDQRCTIGARSQQARAAGVSVTIDAVGSALPSEVELVTGTGFALPLKPSIAVLPFTDFSAQGSAEGLADGIADEISVTLAGYSTLFVIASDSSLTYRDPTIDRAEICRQLGVRYLLSGTVRRAGDRVRVNVRLLDGIAGIQVWAAGFEDSCDQIFALQDRIAVGVAPQIDSTIEISERQRALIRPVQSADAYHLFWRANALFRQWGRSAMLEAIDLTEQVLEIEPTNAWAAGLAAFCHGSAFASRWTDRPEENLAAAHRYYDLAMQHGGDDPFVLGYAAGTLIGIGGDMKIADHLIERALVLQPRSPSQLFWGAWVDVAMGNLERAKERFQLALRINPRSAGRPYSITGIGVCLLALGRLDDAIVVLEEAVQHLPGYPVTVAALCVAHAFSGRLEQAQSYARELRMIGGVEPVLGILNNPDHRKLLEAGIAMAEAHQPVMA